MSDKIDTLNEITERIKRINSKMLLLELIVKAKSEYEKYDYDSGRRSLIEAYLIDKKRPVVLRGLGCINQFKGKFEVAEKYFKKALRYSEKKEVEYTLLGVLYYVQNRLEDAIQYFNLAIDTNDSYDYAYEGRNQAMLENHIKIADLQDYLKRNF